MAGWASLFVLRTTTATMTSAFKFGKARVITILGLRVALIGPYYHASGALSAAPALCENAPRSRRRWNGRVFINLLISLCPGNCRLCDGITFLRFVTCSAWTPMGGRCASARGDRCYLMSFGSAVAGGGGE